jgi:hypothetical protein
MLILTVLYHTKLFIGAIESESTEDISLKKSIFDEPYTNFNDYHDKNILTSEDFDLENCIFYTPDKSKVQKDENKSVLNIDQSTLYATETLTASSESSFSDIIENTGKIDDYRAPEKKKGSQLEFSVVKDNEVIEEFEDFIMDLEKTEDNLICDETLRSKFDCTIEKNCDDSSDNYFKRCKSEIKSLIVEFIKSNLTKQHIDFYIKRLEMIERAYDVLDNFDQNDQSNVSSSQHELELLSLLKNVHVNFKHQKKFDKKTFEIFSRAYDSEFSLKMSLLRIILEDEQPVNYSKYSLYFELMKLYKYVDEIPQLMSLCGIYTNRVFCATPSILHLINLFLEQIGNIRDDKVFVLCLLNKAFLYSNRRDLDLFLVKKYKVVCHRKHLNLHFLFWELNLAKRNDIRKKLKHSDTLIINDVDKNHLKTIFLIYLYQHTYFLRFYNFKKEEFETFRRFFEKVVFSKSCFACQFEEYLEMIKKQLKSFE